MIYSEEVNKQFFVMINAKPFVVITYAQKGLFYSVDLKKF